MEEMSARGTVRVAEDVIAVIAGIVASETEGLAAMSAGLKEGFAKRVSGKNRSKGIDVTAGEQEAVIHMRIVVEYGAKIHEITERLQRDVKDTVEAMTGLRVREVNVHVEGVDTRSYRSQ